MFIFCLCATSPDISANLGAAYLDKPSEIITTLHTIAPQGWRSLLFSGSIDGQIRTLHAEKDRVQDAMNVFLSTAKNIETVNKGNQSALQTLQNWWDYTDRYTFYNPWSGNNVVKNMNTRSFLSSNNEYQTLTNKKAGIVAEILGWNNAKDHVALAYREVDYRQSNLEEVYKNGITKDSDATTLDALHRYLKKIKDSVANKLTANNDPDVDTKMDEYTKANLFGNQENYKNQWSKLWRKGLVNNGELHAQGWFHRIVRGSRRVFNLLPGATEHPYLAGLGYTAAAGLSTYALYKIYGWKAVAKVWGVALIAGAVANAYCCPGIPLP